MFSVLGAEARRLMLPGPVVAAAHCKTHQKLEIFGNFVASRSAGPFVGRHFLLERHFAGEMISVGKARRCPFNVGGQTGKDCLLTWADGVKVADRRDRTRNLSLRKRCTNHCTTGPHTITRISLCRSMTLPPFGQFNP